MDSIAWDKLPDDIKEAIAAEAGDKAETEGLQREYGELIDMYEIIQAQNKAILEDTLQAYTELDGELFGDYCTGEALRG